MTLMNIFTHITKLIFYAKQSFGELTPREIRTNAIWSLFGLHIGNGENFLSCSGLLSFSNESIKKDFGEVSIEYVKLCYWLGWTRKKIDDTLGAKYWFLKAKGIILRSSIKGCEDYLKWCKIELESEN